MLLTFLGGAGTVTGSKTLVEPELPGGAPNGSRILIDCGMFQGPRDVRRLNWEPFSLDPATIDAMVLTHAHLDHCGYLPALVRDGFTGPVYCSPNTAALAPIILRDSARLQEEDTAWARKKGFSRHADPEPLYDSEDAERAIELLTPIEFGQTFEPVPDLQVRLDVGGHILGSSVVTVHETSRGRTVVFSGDLGRGNHPLLAPPSPPCEADAIVLESTYGDRAHGEIDSELDEMAAVITRTLKRGGTVVIPAFAVDRTEVLLRALRALQDQQRIPVAPIHVDSPMALAALRVYLAAIRDGDPEITSAVRAEGEDAIDMPNLHEATTPQQSMALDSSGARIIVSASGMATGGRVTHHLKAFLPDRDNCVLLVGFQAVGTPGRMLLDGAHEIKIHGQYIPVHAEIAEIEAFSVHADADELLAWLSSCRPLPSQVFLNHGEPDSSEALAERIRSELDLAVDVPEMGERVRV
ncbi:MAG: MBL fold metallo-hydrolase [Candidatus Nanopelagicales bacterium]|nr:MBL fold metallo-hydrolase [Candidatus Nanopelagicales bacterium]MCF8536282.1 MBL fold metallo-hydrolase [Candidatus Nanopelagicales bacterium]MCF8541959.1 MBL fold metallo-hydrolase [Candidatus Nanopelagicales bacterium]MCF8556091.1 MBL fold metallo-hydrolase [Candidatus Nanopelagicales bacterium]